MQLDLLKQAAPLLKSGGTIVYSTCSLEPEENAGVTKVFLAENPGYKLERERQLVPFTDGVDGAYVRADAAKLIIAPGHSCPSSSIAQSRTCRTVRAAAGNENIAQREARRDGLVAIALENQVRPAN